MNPTISDVKAAYWQPRKLKNISRFYEASSLVGLNIPEFYQREYFSPFNLIFLSKLQNLSLFQVDGVFLVRDGLFHLLYFFLKYPIPPEEMNSVLLLPEPFKAFIPKKWRERSLLYHYQKCPPKALTESGGTILTGHLAGETFNLDLALSLFNQQSSGDLLLLFEDDFPPIMTGQMGMKSESLELKRKFYSAMPEHLRFVEDRQVYGLSCHTGWRYIDLDRSLFIYDKWSDHYFSGLGLQSLRVQHASGEISLAVTLFEQIEISSFKTNVPNHFDDLFIVQKLLKISPTDYPRFIRGRIIRHFPELS